MKYVRNVYSNVELSKWSPLKLQSRYSESLRLDYADFGKWIQELHSETGLINSLIDIEERAKTPSNAGH